MKQHNVGDVIAYLTDAYSTEAISVIKANPNAIGMLVDKVSTHFERKINPFFVRTVVHVFLFGDEAPRRIVQMAIDEMSKMTDVAVAFTTEEGERTLDRISFALEVFDRLMTDPDFGGTPQ
jgi:hypothetical protein